MVDENDDTRRSNDDDTVMNGPDDTVIDGAAHSGVDLEVENYRIIQLVGEGGMGEVYEAEQLRPSRSVNWAIGIPKWRGR